jgi:hypothetical protein
MNNQTFDQRVQRHIDNLRKLLTSNGLFLASSNEVTTGYDKAWLRDNVYEALAFEYAGHWDVVEKDYHTLLDIFDKHIDKINWATTNKPFESWQFIHARYNPDTLEEFWESWGNKQHDAVGAVLFKLADFEQRGHSMLRNDDDRKTVQTLIHYICNVEYWHDADSGMWEENEEMPSSLHSKNGNKSVRWTSTKTRLIAAWKHCAICYRANQRANLLIWRYCR